MELAYRAWVNGVMRYDVTGFEDGGSDVGVMEGVFLDGDYHKIAPNAAIVMPYVNRECPDGNKLYLGDTLQFDYKEQESDEIIDTCTANIEEYNGSFVLNWWFKKVHLSDISLHDFTVMWCNHALHKHKEDRYYELVNMKLVGNKYEGIIK